jgi:hypothetical protein
MRNHTGWYIMEREDRDIEDIKAQLQEWWLTYASKRPEAAGPVFEVSLAYRESWCPGWFSHWTFRRGLSDADVLSDFASYVDRIMYDYPEREAGAILMGAEESWRWHARGGNSAGDDERLPAPCNCEHCIKAGVVRIDH